MYRLPWRRWLRQDLVLSLFEYWLMPILCHDYWDTCLLWHGDGMRFARC